MLRDISRSDRDLFIGLGKEFYSSDAVSHPIPAEYFARTFDSVLEGNPHARALLFEHEGQTAGYALLALTWSNEAGGMVVWLEEAYIRPAFQGKGLGTELFRFVEAEYKGKAKRLRLEVVEENTGAIRLYKRMGFEGFPYRQMIKEL